MLARRLSRRCTMLIAVGALLLALAPVMSGSASAGSALDLNLGSAAACPSGTPAGTVCAKLPAGCTSNCGLVQATPTGNLADGEAVHLGFSGFTGLAHGTVLDVFYCSLVAAPPLACSSNQEFGTDFLPSVQVVAPDAAGSGALGYRVQSITQANHEAQLSSQYVAGTPGHTTGPPFYCDDGANPCAVVVVETQLTGGWPYTISPAQLAAFPVTFSASTGGCALGTPTLATEDSWTIERLLPAVNSIACRSRQPVVDQGLSTDSESVAAAMVQSAAVLGFTDDPEDPVVQHALSKGHFAYIPVAVSATVVAFSGPLEQGPKASQPDELPYLGQLNLTPNETAGVLTGLYHDMGFFFPSADPVTESNAPSICHVAFGCSVLALVNPTPSGFTLSYDGMANYFYANASGTSAELTDWFCSAPNTPLDISGTSFTDPNVASTTFTTNNGLGDAGANWPITRCQTMHSLNPIFTDHNGTPPRVNTANSPDDEATAMEKWVANNEFASAIPQLAFGPMDSSQAGFYGFPVASLQNPGGTFVTPTAASVAAALSAAKTNPDGTVSPDFGSTDPTAYPMPLVTYAIVSKTPQPAAQAALVKSLLLSMLGVTGPAGLAANAAALPAGYFPLPKAMYDQALRAVQADVLARPAHLRALRPRGHKSSGSGSSPGSGSPGGGPSSPSGPGSGGGQPGGGSSHHGRASLVAAHSKSGSAAQLAGFTVPRTTGTWLLVLVVVLGASGLLGGGGLLLVPRLRTLRLSRSWRWTPRLPGSWRRTTGG